MSPVPNCSLRSRNSLFRDWERPIDARKREYIPSYPGADFFVCEHIGKDFNVPFNKVLSDALPLFPLIAMDQEVLSGTPRIAGTRIPVSMVLDAVQFYGNVEGVITSYPDLIPEQVQQAISFASVVLERSVEHEFTNSLG